MENKVRTSNRKRIGKRVVDRVKNAKKKSKRYKVTMSEGFAADLNAIPTEDKKKVWDELDKVLSGFKDGTIDPGEIAKPINMEELKEEDPELFNLLIERSASLEEEKSK